MSSPYDDIMAAMQQQPAGNTILIGRQAMKSLKCEHAWRPALSAYRRCYRCGIGTLTQSVPNVGRPAPWIARAVDNAIDRRLAAQNRRLFSVDKGFDPHPPLQS